MVEDASDSIASHSFRVTIIGLLLARQEKADVNKVVTMCLLHDVPEARSGDQNWVHKKYVKVFEEEIIADQLENLPNNKDIKDLVEEYEKRQTKEAIIAKDADLIDQVLLLKEYEMMGNKEAARWLSGKHHVQMVKTSTGKKLVAQICKLTPSVWWYKGGWTEKRRK